MKSLKIMRAFVPAWVLLAGAVPAYAQSQSDVAAPAAPKAAPGASVAESEEIVVTARRVAENSQKVPISITAFS